MPLYFLMTELFVLQNLKPLSVNMSYSNVGRSRVKSQDAIRWYAEVFFQLKMLENQQKLERLRSYFDYNKHAISVRLTAYYPRSQFVTKEGRISAKTIDITNWEKSIIDALLLSKFHERELPNGAPNMNTDDKYLLEMQSRKRIAHDDQYRIEAAITILDLNIENYVG